MKIKNIILENPESDRELFGAPTFSGYQARQELKNMDNAYAHATRQELVNHVRDLAKNQFGVKTRVSAVAKKAGARTATFWFGSGEYVAGNPDKIVHEIKAELESQGFACKFTDSGWLSVRVPEDYERNSVVEDESDDDLFGTEALRKFAVVSPDGEILKELENGTVRQAIEMARAAFVKWGNYYKDYGGIALIRSNIEGEYDENSQEIPFSKKIDESDMSDDEMFGNSSMLSKAAAKRIRKDDPVFSSLAVKINQLVRKLQNSSFDWDVLRRGSTLYDVLVNNDRALDEILWELPDHVLERLVDELENLCDRYVKESELAEAESDDELFGTEAARKFAICSSDGEILKELENVTVQQAMEMARKMSARFSDDYDDLLLIRSDLNGEYDNAQIIPFSTEIDESDESDDDLFGGKSHKRRNQLKIFDPDALPRLDPATQQKVYRALPSVLQDIQEDDD